MSTAMPKATRSWYQKKRYNVPLGIIVALTVIGGFTETKTNDPVTPTSDAAAVATVTTTVTTESAPQNDTDDQGQAVETEDADPEPTAEASGRQSQEPKPVAKRKPIRTYSVSRVIDGDTVELGTGDDVRIVGIDTPERGECGYAEATANMVRMVASKRVRLNVSDEDHDRYGRLLRYVNIGTMDAGLQQIENGLAIARYDSRDGYGEHPRQARYIAADSRSANKASCPPKPEQEPKPTPKPQGGDCAPGYDPCLPIVSDLNCADVDGPIYVTGSDPYGLDGENDGTGCES